MRKTSPRLALRRQLAHRRIMLAMAASLGLIATVWVVALTLGGGAKDALPLEKQAAYDRMAQEQAVGRDNPAPKHPDATPPVDMPEPGPRFPNVKTQAAGAGTIIKTQFAPPGAKNSLWKNLWQEQGPAHGIALYAGAVADDPQQGVVFWMHSGPPPAYLDTTAAQLPTPTRHGAVHVESASGEVLTLRADDGTTFTFNAATGQFQ
jgi:hypothetical protein